MSARPVEATRCALSESSIPAKNAETFFGQELCRRRARGGMDGAYPVQGPGLHATVGLPGPAQQAHNQGSRCGQTCLCWSAPDRGAKARRSIGLLQATLPRKCKVSTHKLQQLCSLMEVEMTPQKSSIRSQKKPRP